MAMPYPIEFTGGRNFGEPQLGQNVGKKLNDRDAVLILNAAIDACRSKVNLTLTWIPREQNLAGHYIQHKYQL